MPAGPEASIVLLSLKVTIVAIAIGLPFAFALAFVLSRRRFAGRTMLDALVHLPLVLPPVVIGWMLLLAFGREGPAGALLERLFGVSVIFRWIGAAIASAIMALPLMVRAIRLSLDAVDPRLEQAARTLGARPADVFSSITLPLCAPGILTAAVLGFARAIGEFGATITFVSNIPGETQTLPLAIYSALQVPGGEAEAWRLSLASIALSLGALMISEWLARRHSADLGHVL